MYWTFLLLVGIGVFIVAVIRSVTSKNKSYQLEVRGLLGLKQELRSLSRDNHVQYFIIEFGDYYIQFSKFPDTQEVICESVSNEYLLEEFHLTDHQYGTMKGKGFYLPGEKDEEDNSSKNFFRFYSIDKDVEIDQLLFDLESIMTEVYGYQNNHVLHIKVNPK